MYTQYRTYMFAWFTCSMVCTCCTGIPVEHLTTNPMVCTWFVQNINTFPMIHTEHGYLSHDLYPVLGVQTNDWLGV